MTSLATQEVEIIYTEFFIFGKGTRIAWKSANQHGKVMCYKSMYVKLQEVKQNTRNKIAVPTVPTDLFET